MDNRPVLFLDSGIGGLPYFKRISDCYNDEQFIYAADRKNFPYGQKDKKTLIDLLERLIFQLVEIYDPKIIVIACNTASVSALDSLRNRFPRIPFIGTVPAVRPAVEKTQTGIIGVLGTSRTIQDPYIHNLAKTYRSDVVIKGIAAPELVDFVEHQFLSATLEEKQKIVSKYLDDFRIAGADGVVLGCTHFLFLLDEFRKAAASDLIIYDSIDGVFHQFSAILREQNSNAAKRNEDKNILLITGNDDAEPIWKQRAESYNMELKMLDHIQQKKGNV
jgi:glutamate racemase